jgi:hypothetical protein
VHGADPREAVLGGVAELFKATFALFARGSSQVFEHFVGVYRRQIRGDEIDVKRVTKDPRIGRPDRGSITA